MDQNIEIRRMQEKDFSQVCLIEQAIFAQPWSRGDFADASRKPENIYLVACEQEQILGYLGIWGVAGEGQVTNVAVTECARRRGIAYALFQQAFVLGKQMGIEAYTLEVRVSNKNALALYEKLGFRSAGIRKNFYDFPKEDANIMWR